MSDIIVGYDGSDCAQAALALAFDAGRALDDHVVVAFAFEHKIVGGQNADLRDALREVGEARVADAAKRAEEAGVSIETVVLEDSPAAALAELASQREARLIIVGTRGESPLKGALVGSTPHKLIQLADRPVVIVPAG
jgi:nucleotide-binding universal stress UspA family protein